MICVKEVNIASGLLLIPTRLFTFLDVKNNRAKGDPADANTFGS
jgi:hypothetical protein